jgi:flagellar secretion chaperone FliS
MDARSSYRETAVRGARPLQLVILLYEQGIEDLRRAIVALEKNDVEGRTREINHAILVIGHLQASLDRDLGGPVAANLERFYDQVRAGLVEAQFRQSAAALEQQIAHLMQVHEAWCEVERSSAMPAIGQSESAHSPAEDEFRSFAEWNA